MRALAAILLAGLALVGCSEVDEAATSGYEPAHLEEVEGSDVKRVTFTAEGAARTGLETTEVERRGRHRSVPYAALIYDQSGESWVYTVPRRLTYVRAPVRVARIEQDRVLFRQGPPAGTGVVTVGAAEVYGAELEIAGGH